MAPLQPPATGPDPLIGDLDLGAEGLEGLDVEIDGPTADPVAAHQRYERFPGQVQQRPEQEDGYPVEPAEGKRYLWLGLFGRGDLELAVTLFHARPDGPQYPRRDLDVAHFGHVGDGARPFPQQGGDHVLGHRVLGAIHLHVADQGTIGLDEPCV